MTYLELKNERPNFLLNLRYNPPTGPESKP